MDRFKLILFSHAESGIYVKPDIPENELANALTSYAKDVKVSDVLVLYDSTLLGNAKEGVCLSSEWLFWRNPGEEPQKVRVCKIATVKSHPNGIVVNGNKIVVDDEGLANALVQVIVVARDAVKTSCTD